MEHVNHIRIGAQNILTMRNVGFASHARSQSAMPMLMESHGVNALNVKVKIQSVEKEAYAAVLRAFIAQSDVLSWDKEQIITELRKELNVSDDEHKELLASLCSNESIKIIREWQKGKLHASALVSGLLDVPEFLHRSTNNLHHNVSRASNDPVLLSQRQPTRSRRIRTAYPASIPVRPNNQWSETFNEMPSNPVNTMILPVELPSSSKQREASKCPSRFFKESFKVGHANDSMKKSNVITIRLTDVVINEVTHMVYGRENPDSIEIKKAKSILRVLFHFISF
ncbi:protein EMSY-LIKE 4-like [Impatiens glandulifera]|uniref:protein EMSY-LIKE 4-like n=1 Tax=Impatiens glandulifera TaxID=253017 RepID=UPI001FB04B54|nr:protein EMSY-LIKE 4-like [Impatiens glandulifera]